MQVSRCQVALVAGLFALLSTVAVRAQGDFATEFFLEDCTFAADGETRFFFTLNPGDHWEFEGDEDGTPISLRVTVLDELEELSLPTDDGERDVMARIIEEREWEDGDLVEVSRNFFVRCVETNDIFYFGEDVDDYEDDEIVGHEGAWRVGEDGAMPGLIMPGTFVPGAAYFQEFAPGVAEDRAEHLGMGREVDTAAGIFEDCVEVVETTPLDLEEESTKIYCPGVGMVVDDELELVSFERSMAPDGGFAADFALDDCTFTSRGENRFFLSLNPGDQWDYEGDDDGTPISLRITILDELQEIVLPDPGGEPLTVLARIIEEREWEDGELVEVSRNFFARCRETDDIYYFGEDVDDYEDGEVVGHEGAWRAGVEGALPGLIMPGSFVLGAAYFQEVAPDVAMDRAKHVAMGLDLEVDAGEFEDCVQVLETTPLEPGEESTKMYCPGVGLVVDDNLELVSFVRTPVPENDRLLPGDVAPGARTDDGRWEVTGDDEIDISDVVVLLRAAVLLHELDLAP